MNQVPHITIEQASILYTNAEPMLKLSNELIDKHNARIDKANAEQEQPLITAEEARKLGAGNAMYFATQDNRWCPCGNGFSYSTTWGASAEKIQYLAIKPEPVEPTCQVRNEDTGELKTMTREAAKLLQAELGATVEWIVHGTKYEWEGEVFAFDGKGNIYTYKLKAKPLKQVSWKDVPVGVMVIYRGHLYPMYRSPIMGYPCVITTDGLICQDFLNSDFELAPASEQDWLNWRGGECPVPEGVTIEVELRYGKTSEWRDLTHACWSHNVPTIIDKDKEIISFRITGLAEGWVLR